MKECEVCNSYLNIDEDGEVVDPCSYAECPHRARVYDMEDYDELNFHEKYYGLDDIDIEGC